MHKKEARLVRAYIGKKLKLNLPGPMTIIGTIARTHYRSKVAMAMDFMELLDPESRALQDNGLDLIQFNEPAFNLFVEDVGIRRIAALHRAIEGLTCMASVQICYSCGNQANIDWKGTLGEGCRQYKEIFPALAENRIDQISLCYRNVLGRCVSWGRRVAKTFWLASLMSCRISWKVRRTERRRLPPRANSS